MSYHQFRNEEGEDYGSFEVFHSAGADLVGEEGERMPDGWYWWACFPGCLPDGEPCGPFDTADLAIADARGDNELSLSADERARGQHSLCEDFARKL